MRARLSSLLVLSLLGLATTGRADPASVRWPFYGEVGLYVPSVPSPTPTVALAAGYSFLVRPTFSVSAQARLADNDSLDADLNSETDAKGNDVNELPPLFLGFDARYRPAGSRMFVGASVGANQIPMANDANTYVAKLSLGAEMGYNFNRRLYGIARYEATMGARAELSAFTVGMGLRF